MSTAPFGVPVVPPVYCSSATSVCAGPGCAGSSAGASATRCSQPSAPGAGPVMADRVARAFGTGSRSASRFGHGSARVRSTATTVRRPGRSSPCTSGATLSQTTATVAPWSANWVRSSSAVYSGLCSTTTAPSRSAA
nr:hypothetical protein [Modestobacter roseus]